MVLIISLTILFHLLVIVKVIPYTIVGGGRIDNDRQLLIAETAAIAINIFMLWIVLMRIGSIRGFLGPRKIRFILWIMFALFTLNTIGNFFALTQFERWVFTPLTSLLAILSLRLAMKQPDAANKI